LSPAPRQAHELAIKLLGGNLSYPTTLFVTNNFEYTLLVPGYLDEKKIEPLLVFMVENAWKNAPYEEFSKHFNNTFYDTTFAKAPVKTYDIREIEKLQKKNPKKILVNFGAEFCNTCRVMKQTTFVDTSLAAYINKNFYLVNFDAGSKDTVVFNGVKSFNTVVNNFPLHTLGMQLSGNRFSLPTLCMLDEQYNTIDALNFYQSPERLKPILTYIATNTYKTKNFNDFMQEYMKPAPAVEVKKKK
jgi:thioredoxin-related protein